MTARFTKELNFMLRILRQLRVQAQIIHPGNPLRKIDRGLREMLGISSDYEHAFRIAELWTRHNTIYKLTDQFMCHYIYFHLQETPASVVIIGPYITEDPTEETLLELCESLSIPLVMMPQMMEYFSALPIFADPSPILAIVNSFGELLWGDPHAFVMVDVDYEQSRAFFGDRSAPAPIEQVDVLQKMQQLEERYAYENELMEIVSKGLTHRAEMMMSSVSQLSYQKRLPDPLRNIKNYCIICNTLLRKAAQTGGVHPIHLDNMSSQFARRIENVSDPTLGNQLIGEMIRSYCRLVRSQKGSHLSALVQRARTYIDANLSGDLSLGVLSKMMNVTPGYLSTLFHRETGTTLSNYIITQRLHAAMNLLGTTNLQIQSIAQLCGFSDPNYFSKQFKHVFGFTPLQYRHDHFRRSQLSE